ncbi:MAG: hypothetical protein EA419_00255 [Wenzhouxiangella sp.]|nr:MAG: hypothetical protein EA419_00255 [Wenzhouxiangella sp.]
MLRRQLKCGWLIAIAVYIVALAAWLTPLLGDAGQAPLAIEGYSPVSYFEHGRAERGNPKFSAVHNGYRYHFTDAGQMATFQSDPARFEPLFTEHCPYSLTLGRAVAIDPENFRIVDGHLLLFHRSEEMDGLEEWNAADDDRGLLEQAKSQYTLFRF